MLLHNLLEEEFHWVALRSRLRDPVLLLLWLRMVVYVCLREDPAPRAQQEGPAAVRERRPDGPGVLRRGHVEQYALNVTDGVQGPTYLGAGCMFRRLTVASGRFGSRA
jgi:hypothetical protein